MAETKFIKTKKDKNYTVLDNTFIQDLRLTWKAKGLMTYLLSLPDDWCIHLSELEEHAADGKDSLKTAIKELKIYGYLIATQKKNEAGRFCETVYTVIEKPLAEKPLAEKPLAEKPLAEKPLAEKPPLLNTNIQSTNINKVLNKQSTNNTNITANVDENKKHKFGDYQNVLLKDSELDKLVKLLGFQKAKGVIDNYSELKEMKGYKYKSDYLAIKRWGIKAYEDNFNNNQKKGYDPKTAGKLTCDVLTDESEIKF